MQVLPRLGPARRHRAVCYLVAAMPELPEVETVARGLRAAAVGQVIAGVRFGKTDFVKDPSGIERNVPGRRIAAIERYGKLLALVLKPAAGTAQRLFLMVHLGMTGRFTVTRAADPVPLHTHVVFTLDDGRELRFTDPRRFGRMRLADEASLPALVGRLGVEPLDISAPDFAERVGCRRAMLKALLLNQSVLRGMGNIYTDEALWRARLHPRRIAARCDRAALRRLHRAIRQVLSEAIRAGGSSVSDYVDANGAPGWFQLRHRAYDREGRPCFRCRTKIRRIIVAGRSSFFCPRCQPAPRHR